jgi:hypothetical protein
VRQEPRIGLQQLDRRAGWKGATHRLIVSDKIADSQTLGGSDADHHPDAHPGRLAFQVAGTHPNRNRNSYGYGDRETVGFTLAGTYPNHNADADSGCNFNLRTDQRADCRPNDSAFGESVRVGGPVSCQRSSTPVDHSK